MGADAIIAQLSKLADERSGHAFLDAALAQVRDAPGADALRALAAWAEQQAAARPGSPRYGLLRMLAGAAVAAAERSAQLEQRAARAPRAVQADQTDADQLLDALHALQDRLDAGSDAAVLLTEFAPLGARLLLEPAPPSIDMRLRTDPDDTVFYWTSGVMALKRSA